MTAKKLHREYNAYEQVVYTMEKQILEAMPTAVLKFRQAFDTPFLRAIPGTNAVFDATNDVLEARELESQDPISKATRAASGH